MTDMFSYHVPDRTVRIRYNEEQELTAEQANVVALVKIGDELASLNNKIGHIIKHGIFTGN